MDSNGSQRDNTIPTVYVSPQWGVVHAFSNHLADDVWFSRVKKIVQGPMGQIMPARKGHVRHNSDPFGASAASLSDITAEELCLRGKLMQGNYNYDSYQFLKPISNVFMQ